VSALMGLVTLSFDLLTLKLLCESKVGNLPSKFGHARPLGSRIIRYVRDGRTDGRIDGQKATLIVPFPPGDDNVIRSFLNVNISVNLNQFSQSHVYSQSPRAVSFVCSVTMTK